MRLRALTALAAAAVLSLTTFACSDSNVDSADEASGAATATEVKPGADRLMVDLKDSPSGGAKFTFCSKPPANSSMAMTNAQWLSMIAANEYAHLAYSAPQLSALGFGRSGDELWAVCGLDLARVRTFEENHAAELGRSKKAGAADLVRFMKGESRPENFGVCAREFLEKKYTGKDEDNELALPTEAFKEYLLRTNDTNSWMQFYSGKPYTFMEKLLGKGSTQVVMARHSKLPVVIISFRGSELGFDLRQLSDFFADLILSRSDTAKLGFSPGWGGIHTGFLNAMMSLDDLPAGKSLLTTKLRDLTKDDPNVGIWITGHSLGGGLATVMAARILDEIDRGAKFNLKGLYTYGSPRVGNEEFVTRFNARTAARGVHVARFRKANDIVTAIPGVFMGYKHVGKLAFLTDDKLDFGAATDPDYASKSMEDHDIRGYFARIGKQRPLHTDLDACESTGTDHAALGL